MSTKPRDNGICACGSGKKYKKCCKLIIATERNIQQKAQTAQNDWNAWIERVSSLPFTAVISTENGTQGSMMVESASITKDGITTELFNDPITLSTNQCDGDQTDQSSASICISQDLETKSGAQIIGNANVKNKKSHYDIGISGNPKNLKVKSPQGLFAIIKIIARRDCGFNCFDILFGEAGREEIISHDGIKQRPHLTIFPDGNNKYFRLAGYKCNMEAKLQYEPNEKSIHPLEYCITFDDYSEKLLLSFMYSKDEDRVVLINATFQ
jgi:hypothetical protein